MKDLEIKEQAEKMTSRHSCRSVDDIRKKATEYCVNSEFNDGAVRNGQRIGFEAGAKWMQEQDEWISVEDRLPYKDGDSSIYCLVFATGYDIIVRPYNEYHKCWDDEDGDDNFTKDVGGLVTHWQPLPSPPKTK